MVYPTLEQVEDASRVQLLRWTRFLPSPGMSALTNPERPPADHLEKVMAEEKVILDRIIERQEETGGITPAISKAVGWD